MLRMHTDMLCAVGDYGVFSGVLLGCSQSINIGRVSIFSIPMVFGHKSFSREQV